MTITINIQQIWLNMYFHGHITQLRFGVVNNNFYAFNIVI